MFNQTTRYYDRIADANIANIVEMTAMPPVKVDVPVVTMIGILGKQDKVCQTYPQLCGSAGNTLQFPNPLDVDLQCSIYNGASYFIQVTFNNASSKRGLIAVPHLRISLDLRVCLFNVPVEDRPVKVDLYRFEIDCYPNVTSSSIKTLLHFLYN